MTVVNSLLNQFMSSMKLSFARPCNFLNAYVYNTMYSIHEIARFFG